DQVTESLVDELIVAPPTLTDWVFSTRTFAGAASSVDAADSRPMAGIRAAGGVRVGPTIRAKRGGDQSPLRGDVRGGGDIMRPFGGSMERVTRTKDLNPELWKIFDEYVHGFIDRRGFMDRAAKYVAAPMTAAMALDLMSPNFAEAQQVKPDDKRIKTEW